LTKRDMKSIRAMLKAFFQEPIESTMKSIPGNLRPGDCLHASYTVTFRAPEREAPKRIVYVRSDESD
jgi:hypothetical protein